MRPQKARGTRGRWVLGDSLLRRHFFITAGMILLCFALLAAGFMYLSYRYTIHEKKTALWEEADYVADCLAEIVGKLRAMSPLYDDFIRGEATESTCPACPAR